MKTPLAAIGGLMIVALSTGAYASDQEGLQLELTPYVWATGIDGKASAAGQTVHFNVSFSDLLQDVDAAFMGLAMGSYNRFLVYVDYFDAQLGVESTTKNGTVVPVGTKVKLDADNKIITYAAGYRFDTFGENTIDVMIGSRKFSLDSTIKLPNVKFNSDGSLTDTIVMLRPSFRFAEKWRFNPTLSYGISGDSDTTYEMAPQIQWDFSNAFAARFGYRKMFYEEGNGDEKLDIAFQGLFVGMGWIFPARN